MGRVFLGIAFGVLLVMLVDEWNMSDLSLNGLLSSMRQLSSIQSHGPAVESHTH
jgi:hypothetical protein